ncbi:hydroxyacid dehydrogenase [Rhizobiales bacterium RZME27]|uniref:Hydroxyacid dehydrogenase n=1 Tax=Endobacterium cereale TaxID=2663029 RepID=A0A6A8AHJ5_9HYPH|nr:glyoxylate/hydroxypyruvate reductase A [Endobacterium cereale]MEB2847449.1 glyoxylate/hydroxypyruvate reductase A [Endobacterium cereale]MQY49297.1 hydroxyacid dehydrogenase [Endobacterium cereale]
MTSSVPTIEIVALSQTFDLAQLFAPGEDQAVRVVRPEEVSNPERIEIALAWRPEGKAFDAYPNLKMVSSIAAGVDSILACPSLRQDTVVTRVRDHSQADLMAGFAAFQVIWHHRRMGDYIANQARHVWDRSFRPQAPGSVTVGVLGYGLMGRKCAMAIAAMGFRVVVARNSVSVVSEVVPDGVEVFAGPDAIHTVAAQADILVNILPLTDTTRDILDHDFFARMRKGAALVQMGRGEHMIEDDLLSALDSGHLSGASVDVFRQEPPEVDHPFWSHPKIMVTPHKASDTSPAEVLRQVLENFAALREGRLPPGLVNREAGY